MDHAIDKRGGMMGCNMLLYDVSLKHEGGMPDCSCMTGPLADGQDTGLTRCSDLGLDSQNGAS